MVKKMVEIRGNTYGVRSLLDAMGGRYDSVKKCWLVPEDRAAEAQKLAGPAPKTRRAASPRTCKDCGCRINYGTYCGKCEYR